MRKIFAVLLGVLFAVCAAQTARAEEYTTYYLEEYGLAMEIDVPSENVVITRDTSEDDPCFAEMGTTAEEQFAYMEANNVYMQIVDLERFIIIVVTLEEAASEDFGTFSDEDFSLLADYFNEMADQSGMEKYTFKEYVCDSIRYLASSFEMELDGIRSYRQQYYTVYNGATVNVMMMSYSPENMEEKAEMLKEIIDRVRISVPGSAPEGYTKYYLDELGMEISLPEEVYAVTRENVEENPFLDIFGLSPDQALEVLEAENLYLSAVDEEVSFQLMLSVTEVPGLDFREYSDDELKNFLDIKRENYIDIGGTWIGGAVLQLEETSFLKIDFLWNDGKKDIRVQEHYTIYQGKAFNLTLNSYTGSISDEMESMLVQTVGSIRFDTDSQLQEPEQQDKETPIQPEDEFEIFYLEKPDLEITIPGSYVVFTRDMDPENPNFERMGYTWEQVMESMEKGDVYLDALTADESCEILVIEVDISGGYANLDSQEDIDEILEIRKARLEADGMQWISAAVFQHPQTNFLAIDYCYDFGSTTGYAREYLTLHADKIVTISLCSYDGEIPAEQEEILTGIINSVHFKTEPEAETPADAGETKAPEVETPPTAAPEVEFPPAKAPEEETMPDSPKDFLWVTLLVSLVLTVAVYSLPIFIYRWVIRRSPVEKKKAKIIVIVYGVVSWIAMSVILTVLDSGVAGGAIFLWSWINYRVLIGGRDTRRRTDRPVEIPVERDPWDRPEPASEIPVEENEGETEDVVRFCRNCGFELLPGSSFCSRCGKPISVRKEKREEDSV